MNIPLHLDLHERGDFDGIRRDLAEAHHAPGWIYCSEDLAAAEEEKLFLKTWQFVCRSDEIAQVGDFWTATIGREPILVTRGKDGKARAMMNQCAHRGVEVAQGRGNATKFVCPYHAWTYDSSGALIGAPLAAQSGRDLANCRLRPLLVEEWQGWVVVNFDTDAVPFAEFIAAWEPALWFYQAGQCKTAFKVTIEFKCNWKLLTENVSDLYHASAVHGASFGSQFKLKDGKAPVTLIPGGGWVMNFTTEDRKNFPQKFKTLPWLEEHQTFAAGKSAIFPNVNLFANRESMRTSIFRPLAVDRTEATWYFLLPEDSLAAEDADEGCAYYEEQIRVIAGEDLAVVESLQRASASSRYVPGPLMGMEAPIQHMIQYYLDVMDFD